MEGLGLFWFQSLQFFLLAKLARDFAERKLLRIRVEARRRILCRCGRAIIFLCAFVFLCFHFCALGFDLCAVFGSQNVGMLQVFLGVNMLGAFL
jgi:hypothetical protein